MVNNNTNRSNGIDLPDGLILLEEAEGEPEYIKLILEELSQSVSVRARKLVERTRHNILESSGTNQR